MTVIIKYAIRRKSDNFYIPQPSGRNGRGGSRVEPIDPENTWESIRFFHKEQAAKIALNAWLKGEWITSRGSTTDYFSGGTEYYEYTNIHPVEGRNKDDMEVVPVEVHLPVKSQAFKPTYKLTHAVFMGNGILWGEIEPDHPRYAQGKAIKCSEIVARRSRTLFETKNSIYDVTFVTRGETTIPKKWMYTNEDGMLCNADGTRSIFDDVDQ